MMLPLLQEDTTRIHDTVYLRALKRWRDG